jgi:hypothetical protein
MIESFITIVYAQLMRVLDAQMVDDEQEELVKSTVKEALLGCYWDWKTHSELASRDVTDDMLRQYARMLIDVSVKFRVSDMLSESMCKDLLDYAKRMRAIADEPIIAGYGNSYRMATDELFTDVYRMYEGFDRRFDNEW